MPTPSTKATSSETTSISYCGFVSCFEKAILHRCRPIPVIQLINGCWCFQYKPSIFLLLFYFTFFAFYYSKLAHFSIGIGSILIFFNLLLRLLFCICLLIKFPPSPMLLHYHFDTTGRQAIHVEGHLPICLHPASSTPPCALDSYCLAAMP